MARGLSVADGRNGRVKMAAAGALPPPSTFRTTTDPPPSMTTNEFAAIDVLDLAALNELRAMLDDALADIVRGFLLGLDADVAAVTDAADLGAVKTAAHSLRGSAGNLCARQLAAVASALETAAQHGDAARCQALSPVLAAAAQRAREGFEGYWAPT